MIDFRYHLVSLISVFLALAVGIVLGAGPLKDTIGDQLSGQVEQLRADKEELRTQLTEEEQHSDNADAYLDSMSSMLLADQLTDVAVAVVVAPGVDKDVIDAATARITQAKGTVTTVATLNPEWYAADKRSYRQNLASTLLDKVEPKPAADAGLDTDLAAALMLALGGRNEADPTALSEGASEALDILVKANLVAVENPPSVPASALLVLAPQQAATDETDEAETDEDAAAAEVAALTAIAEQGSERLGAAVVAGASAETTDLLAAIRADETVVKTVATVDSVDTTMGQISVPLAIADAVVKKVGQYGFREGATAISPTRVISAGAPADPVDPVDPAAGEEGQG